MSDWLSLGPRLNGTKRTVMKVQLKNGPKYPANWGANNPRGPSPTRERKRVGWSGDFHTSSDKFTASLVFLSKERGGAASKEASSFALLSLGGAGLGYAETSAGAAPSFYHTSLALLSTGEGGAVSKEASSDLALRSLGGAGPCLSASAEAAPPFHPDSSHGAEGGGSPPDSEEDNGSISSLSTVTRVSLADGSRRRTAAVRNKNSQHD